MSRRPRILSLSVLVLVLSGVAAADAAGGAPVPGVRVAEQKFEDAMIAAIHLFAEQGEVEHLDTLVEMYPKLVDERQRFRQPRKPYSTDQYTPLHRAARAGQAEAAKVLLLRGADPKADSGGGWTALHIAARAGDLDTVKVLIAGGAAADARTEALEERFEIPPSSPPGAKPVRFPAVPAMTPIDVAAGARHADVVEYLRSIPR